VASVSASLRDRAVEEACRRGAVGWAYVMQKRMGVAVGSVFGRGCWRAVVGLGDDMERKPAVEVE